MRRSLWENLDYAILFVWFCLIFIGLAAIYSATNGPSAEIIDPQMRQNFGKQLGFFFVCTVMMVVVLSLPVRFFMTTALGIYGFMILLVIAARFIGKEVNGAHSWIMIGSFGLQTSEFAKVATALALGWVMSRAKSHTWDIKNAALGIGLLILPALILIVVQNDTGTGLVFLALVPFVLFWSGMPLQWVVLMITPAIAGYLTIIYEPAALVFSGVVVAGIFFSTKDWKLILLGVLAGFGTWGSFQVLYKLLLPHQVARIKALGDPEAYALTTGYQTLQSKAAIGSGGFMGKGWMQGLQTQMGNVPEQSTDFVYTVIGEEFGFLGSFLVLVLFAILLIRLIRTTSRINHPFAQYFFVATVGIFLTHILINIGMTVGSMPVIGIPLPFISYGGSALMANTALLAIAMNFQMRSHEFPAHGY
ncbi:MAG: rod shape-determining protein RodA [Rhodothermia bacterium]|nr:rod shape-determining protein RodA [Rhodothermia bacterium]